MQPKPNDAFFEQNSSEDGQFNYKCDSCGYIHIKFEEAKPTQCVKCGRGSFTRVSDDAKNNQSMNRRNAFIKVLKESSGRERLVYLVMLGVFALSIIGLVLLLV